MWKHGTSLVLLILAGSPANAQTQCPELTRLRAEAVAAAKPTRGPPAPLLPRCETYIRISIAWNDVAKYASDHREACDVSSPTFDAIEKAHREAVKARDRVCMGLPVLAYPADIILR
jgi:hypothetical protein